MRDPILELSRDQLEAIRAGANLVRPEWRERFMNSVADRLERYDRRISDDEVAEAIGSVRSTFENMIDDDE